MKNFEDFFGMPPKEALWDIIIPACCWVLVVLAITALIVVGTAFGLKLARLL